MVHWFFYTPFVVQECPPLVVLAYLLSVTPLEVHQFCSVRIEIMLPFVSGIPSAFLIFVQMMTHNLNVVVPLLSLIQPVRHDLLKIWMRFWCDGGEILLYPQKSPLLFCSHISGDTCSSKYQLQYTTPMSHVGTRFFLYLDFHEWPLYIMERQVVFYWNIMWPTVLCRLKFLGCFWTALIYLIQIFICLISPYNECIEKFGYVLQSPEMK